MKCHYIALGVFFSTLLVWGATGIHAGESSLSSEASASFVSAPLPEDVDKGLKVEESSPAPQIEAAPAPAPTPWKMPQLPILQQMGIDMGGWIQQGITFNNYGSNDAYNGPMCINDLNSQYQMNQLWLYFVKPTKTDGDGFDIGGRIDVVEGTDWRFGQCYGLETTFDSPNSYYGLILPQFYLEVAYDDLTVKMGHFATFTSYEVVPAPLNFFYSHSYMMGGYFDPLLVTGLEADYKLNEHWTAVGGFNRGWMQFEDPTGTLNFLGGVKWVGNEKRSSLSLMVDAGPQTGFTGLHNRETVYMVCTHQLTEKLMYASQYDIGQEQNGSVVTPGQNANYYGLEQMLIRKLNDKWSLGLRFEWVRDEEGSRIAGIGNALLTDMGWGGKPGFAGSFYDTSIGLNYRPCPNCLFRPEVRWDSYDGPRNVAGQLPFNNYNSSTQFTTAMDLVITY
jgi:hypothetical protein